MTHRGRGASAGGMSSCRKDSRPQRTVKAPETTSEWGSSSRKMHVVAQNTARSQAPPRRAAERGAGTLVWAYVSRRCHLGPSRSRRTPDAAVTGPAARTRAGVFSASLKETGRAAGSPCGAWVPPRLSADTGGPRPAARPAPGKGPKAPRAHSPPAPGSRRRGRGRRCGVPWQVLLSVLAERGRGGAPRGQSPPCSGRFIRVSHIKATRERGPLSQSPASPPRSPNRTSVCLPLPLRAPGPPPPPPAAAWRPVPLTRAWSPRTAPARSLAGASFRSHTPP